MKFLNRVSLIALTIVLFASIVGASSDYTEYKTLRARHDAGQPFDMADKIHFESLTMRLGENPLDERGGPDNYGYQFVDNLNGDTATYNWIELRDDASAVWPDFSNPDDAGVTVDLPFNFPFYGANYDQMRVNSNGMIEFNTSVTGWSNQCLPAMNVEGPAVFCFWDDLHMSYGGNGENTDNTIAYKLYPTHAIIEYSNIGHNDAGTPPEDSYSFEVILYSNGRIKCQYQSMDYVDFMGTSTVGIQSASTGPALQYACNNMADEPGDGLAVWYFLTASGLLSGQVLDENEAPVLRAAVTLDGTQMFTYTDASGDFFFPTTPEGVYTVRARMLGYEEDSEAEVTVIAGDQTEVMLTVNSLPTTVAESTHEPLAINDLDTTVAFIDVTDAIDIDEMGVKVMDLDHSYVDDIAIWVESPWGSRVNLTYRHGGSGEDFWNCQFDDLSALSIAQGHAPFTGRYLPEEPLAPMAGHSSVGTWMLYIYDHASQDQGVLNDWSLIFVGEASATGTVSGYVTSFETSDPIDGAEVSIPDAGLTATTDASGYYSLAVPGGEWDLWFAAPGYCEYMAEEVVVENGVTTEWNYAMAVSSGEPSTLSLMEESATGEVTTETFQFVNTGTCDISFTAAAVSDGWLSVSPTEGSVPVDGSMDLTVTYDASELPADVYSGQIEFITTGLDNEYIVEVTLDIASDGDEPLPGTPAEFALHGSYPNPFNSTTEIRYDVAAAAHVSLVVYNLLGQEVRTLVNHGMEPGRHTAAWDGRNAGGASLATGLYIMQLKANDKVFTSKSVLIR